MAYAGNHGLWTKAGITQGSKRFYKRRPVPRLPAGATPDMVEIGGERPGTAQIWTDGWYVLEDRRGVRSLVRGHEIGLP
jgi:hypothetical protein